MDLANHQRILLGLVRANYVVQDEDDDYYRRVAASPDLREARGNIFLWRVYVLERTCVLTVQLLRQQQLLDATLEDFICSHNVSPFREYQPLAFLESLSGHADPLVASVSQFELAMMKVREGDLTEYKVTWPLDPHDVLHCLAQGLPFHRHADPCSYVTRISHELPGLFAIEVVC